MPQGTPNQGLAHFLLQNMVVKHETPPSCPLQAKGTPRKRPTGHIHFRDSSAQITIIHKLQPRNPKVKDLRSLIRDGLQFWSFAMVAVFPRKAPPPPRGSGPVARAIVQLSHPQPEAETMEMHAGMVVSWSATFLGSGPQPRFHLPRGQV